MIPIYNEPLFNNVNVISDLYSLHLFIELVWIQVVKDVFVAKEEMMVHHACIICGLIYGRSGFPTYGILPSLMILSDLCTYFLSVKRFLKDYSSSVYSVSIFVFYVSWFLIRVVGCPIVAWLTFVSYYESRESFLLSALLIHSYLTVMNYISTYKMLVRVWGGGKSDH